MSNTTDSIVIALIVGAIGAMAIIFALYQPATNTPATPIDYDSDNSAVLRAMVKYHCESQGINMEATTPYTIITESYNGTLTLEFTYGSDDNYINDTI